MKIKKGDTVQVIAGKDLGKVGEVTRVILETDKVIVDGVNVAKRHQRATKAHDAGRHHRQGHADPRLERGDRLHLVRQAHADRLPDRRRHEGSGLPQVWEGPVVAATTTAPRLKTRYLHGAARAAHGPNSGSAT